MLECVQREKAKKSPAVRQISLNLAANAFCSEDVHKYQTHGELFPQQNELYISTYSENQINIPV